MVSKKGRGFYFAFYNYEISTRFSAVQFKILLPFFALINIVCISSNVAILIIMIIIIITDVDERSAFRLACRISMCSTFFTISSLYFSVSSCTRMRLTLGVNTLNERRLSIHDCTHLLKMRECYCCTSLWRSNDVVSCNAMSF